MIARYVAQALGWRLLDGALVAEIAHTAHVPTETVVRYDEHVDSWWHRFNCSGVKSAAICAGIAPADVQFFDAESTAAITRQIIEKAAEEGDCVIVGRGGQCVLENRKDVLHVFIHAPWAERVEQVRTGATFGSHVEGMIHAIDREHANYVHTYYGRDWKDPHLYHIMLSSTIGAEQAGWMIADALEQWERHENVD